MFGRDNSKTKHHLFSQNWKFDYVGATSRQLFKYLKSSKNGLNNREVRRKRFLYGPNQVQGKVKRVFVHELLVRMINPLIILLLVIGLLAFFFGDKLSALVVLLMVLMSVTLSLFQERRAERAADDLSALVHTTTKIIREGILKNIPLKDVVPGDIVSFTAGDVIPGDCRIIESNDLFINQSSLTGESLPVEKFAGESRSAKGETPELPNMVFMGSSVVSGTGMGIVVHTGQFTLFGKLAEQLLESKTETLFDKQMKDFIWLMIRALIIVVLVIVGIYAIRRQNLFVAVLYALAVALQITPETIPMIITINLSKGALALSKKKVIVKHLYSIQNFGAMNILCSDKTGTLTMDKITLEKHLDVFGRASGDVFKFGYINSFYETGMKNLLSQAILKHDHPDLKNYKKVDEVPFDFNRKMVTVVVDVGDRELMVSQGAPEEIFKRCSFYENRGRIMEIGSDDLKKIEKQYYKLSADGMRVLAVAYKKITKRKKAYSVDDENKLVLKGYLAFFDPPKPEAKEAIEALKKIGIDFKIITGDNEFVAKKVCSEIGIKTQKMLVYDEIDKLSDSELLEVALKTTIFARTTPMQKERIIKVLRSGGNTVGYLGDGINDALSLKAADIGISVNNAVDVAKESASIILLEKSLSVLADGVLEGRKVFGNFSKYIRMTSMVNMSYICTTVVSAMILPFLPMAPIHLILNNYLYEVGQTAIPSDSVDDAYIKKPNKWNIKTVMRSMFILGPIASVFDFLTFAVLWWIFGAFANVAVFQTGWFLQTMLAQVLVIFVLRTQKIPFIQSRPSKFLIAMAVILLTIVFVLPYTFLGALLRLVPMPAMYYPIAVIILILYLFTIWTVNAWLMKKK